MSDHDERPVGFMGRVRTMKILTWLLIIGLIGLTIGGTSLLFIFFG